MAAVIAPLASATQAAPQPAAGDARLAAAGHSLEMVSQSPWLAPGDPFTVRVLLPTGTPAGTAVNVKLSVYDHLTARSTFEATLSGVPAGGLLDTAGPS